MSFLVLAALILPLSLEILACKTQPALMPIGRAQCPRHLADTDGATAQLPRGGADLRVVSAHSHSSAPRLFRRDAALNCAVGGLAASRENDLAARHAGNGLNALCVAGAIEDDHHTVWRMAVSRPDLLHQRVPATFQAIPLCRRQPWHVSDDVVAIYENE
jgi:hypothetical protein